jgi:hypothetical protein
MNHGSPALQTMNSHSSLITEKFLIRKVPQFGPTSDAHYRVASDKIAVVITLENGCKFNTGYYVSKMLKPLSE